MRRTVRETYKYVVTAWGVASAYERTVRIADFTYFLPGNIVFKMMKVVDADQINTWRKSQA